ncbi:MAG: hybrid sensor histidine kinase/response regulator [Candidatus Gastranaerophilales bacterium]|nr:hybrid sensor histidine kinase/response regulator [Candidatus Gastranaerophilales bacterium]
MEFQQDELNEILNIFQQESSEIIASMDDKLLALEREGNNQELAMHLFRDAHSLKGSARMLGFEEIQNIAHKIEDIISLVKENKLQITSNITDTISECLAFISDLINKTVAQKTEYKSPETAKYIERLVNIAQNPDTEAPNPEYTDKEPDKKLFLEKFPLIEEILIDVLSVLSNARKNNDFSHILDIEQNVKNLIELLDNKSDEKIKTIHDSAKNILRTLDEFNKNENKSYAFLDVNESCMGLIERVSNYADSEKIKRQDYFEIVDKKLSSQKPPEHHNIDLVKHYKTDDLLQRIPLMELNTTFYDETLSMISSAIETNTNEKVKKIFSNIKDIISIYKLHDVSLPHDASVAIKEALEGSKKSNAELNDVNTKIEVIKTMVKFQYKGHVKKPQKSVGESSQKEILNTITNTEIKTLRVDSIKLDNLVGQIRELIVSKIKTNEQLSLAKKINNDLMDWQKNFAKMGYYIKYFDKKYISNPLNKEEWDFRTIMAYNKQLCTLAEQHSEKMLGIMKEMQYLFKQLQESETHLNTTTSEIDNMVKNMRILPLSTIFQLFPRMVHNIAREKNKKIDLVIQGAEITADKTIIEEIKIPLMHIIRNSIDHGIEEVEIRKAMGKNPIGKIEIIATHKDNMIVIDVKDDGKGLDIEKIKAKALEMNILTREELSAINDEELTNLIFYPGFSTENFVTELSGRGLGLDIVNSKINQMQGRIDIFSQINQGTVVRITLPATVATKKVFIIEEQKQLYAIETSVIKTIVRINNDEIFEKDGKNYYIYNNNAVLIYTLSQILNLENVIKETNKYTLMIIETDNTIFGIIVEKLISDQEIVHKKLAAPLYKVKNISGITTLANGEACLILNISDIISTISSTKIGTKIISKHGIIKTQDNFNYKILIVDDSHTTRMLQKNILTNNGYNVSIATNPMNALEKTSQEKYDLVVSDVQMPGMNGFEFIGELRKNKNYENCPVIIVSSEPKEEYTDEIKKNKISAYIQKNLFKQEELITTIKELLSKK